MANNQKGSYGKLLERNKRLEAENEIYKSFFQLVGVYCVEAFDENVKLLLNGGKIGDKDFHVVLSDLINDLKNLAMLTEKRIELLKNKGG